ncbi:MAG: DMT family transporter [Patescibacteria group bacterium]
MNWLIIAIFAHFLFAAVFVIDKFILSKTVLKPAVYVFYAGLLGALLSLLLIPFGFSLIPLNQILISFLSGFLFILATFFFYQSIQKSEVSRIVPLIGGSVPIFTILLSYFLLNERLAAAQYWSFVLLVLGGLIVVWPYQAKQALSGLSKKISIALLASFLFALSYVLGKYIYTFQPFINGFIWMRIGGILGIIFLLAWPAVRQEILKSSTKITFKLGGLALSNKALSAIAFVSLNYAIFLGSVSLVNALQGVQYFFVFSLAIFLSKKHPQLVKEQINQTAIIQKVLAILLIVLGLGLLAF